MAGRGYHLLTTRPGNPPVPLPQASAGSQLAGPSHHHRSSFAGISGVGQPNGHLQSAVPGPNLHHPSLPSQGSTQQQQPGSTSQLLPQTIALIMQQGGERNLQAAQMIGVAQGGRGPIANQIASSPAMSNLARETELAWVQSGRLAETLGDWQRALNSYEAALRIQPHNVDALTQTANILRQQERFLEAAEYFTRVVALREEAGEVWGALGHCYLMIDDLPKAYACYQQAIMHIPDAKNEPKLWYGIGILYDRYGSLDFAEEAFASVINTDPNFDKANEIYFRLGIIYKQQKNSNASLQCFKYILHNPPRPLTEIDIWFQIGHVYEQQQDYEAAKDAYDRVLAANPNHAKVLQQLGGLYQRDGASFYDVEKSLIILTKSLEQDSNDPFSWYLLGRGYMTNGNYGKAYEAYQQAVYRDGKNPAFWCSIGVLYYQITQYHDALDAYSRAIRANPMIPEVWHNLGALYESCNDQMPDAMDAYARTLSLDPSNEVIQARLESIESHRVHGRALSPPPRPQDITPTSESWQIANGNAAGPSPGVALPQPDSSQPQQGLLQQSPVAHQHRNGSTSSSGHPSQPYSERDHPAQNIVQTESDTARGLEPPDIPRRGSAHHPLSHSMSRLEARQEDYARRAAHATLPPAPRPGASPPVSPRHIRSDYPPPVRQEWERGRPAWGFREAHPSAPPLPLFPYSSLDRHGNGSPTGPVQPQIPPLPSTTAEPQSPAQIKSRNAPKEKTDKKIVKTGTPTSSTPSTSLNRSKRPGPIGTANRMVDQDVGPSTGTSKTSPISINSSRGPTPTLPPSSVAVSNSLPLRITVPARSMASVSEGQATPVHEQPEAQGADSLLALAGASESASRKRTASVDIQDTAKRLRTSDTSHDFGRHHEDSLAKMKQLPPMQGQEETSPAPSGTYYGKLAVDDSNSIPSQRESDILMQEGQPEKK